MADSYLDRHQRHELYLQRLATELLNKHAYKNLTEVYRAIRLAILDVDNLSTLTKLNRLNREVESITKELSATNWAEITAQLQAASVYEAGFYAALLGDVNDVSLKTPVDKKILDFVNQSIMTLESSGRTKSGVWSKFVVENTESVYKNAINQITASYRKQESANQAVKRVRTFMNGIAKRDAETLVRTGMSHFSVNARDAMAADNRDIIKKKWFNATFDNRTTNICMAASSSPKNPWDIDDPSAPVLPLHYNERSNWLYLLEGQTEPQGTKAAVGGKDTEQAEEKFDKRKDRLRTASQVKYRGRKDSDVFKAGQVKEHRSGEWLRKQPEWFVRDTLGRERARLFLEEGYPLAKFTDATFRPLTLEQIIARGKG